MPVRALLLGTTELADVIQWSADDVRENVLAAVARELRAEPGHGSIQLDLVFGGCTVRRSAITNSS